MLRMFDFECTDCGAVSERIVDGDEPQFCGPCGGLMLKKPPLIRVNMGPAGAYGYYDENLGTYVRTNAHRRELCRAQGVTPKGETPKPSGEAWV